MKKQIEGKGQWLHDYKAGISYLVIDVKQSNGKTVILAESHIAQGMPAIGFDVIILNGDGTIPKSEKWGERAWTYLSLEHATAVFQIILEKVPIPCRKRHLKNQSPFKGYQCTPRISQQRKPSKIA